MLGELPRRELTMLPAALVDLRYAAARGRAGGAAMTARLRGLPPGRAGRMWLARRLAVAERGADLLERKLRILVAEEQSFALLAERTQGEWEAAVRELDRWMLRAALLSGERGAAAGLRRRRRRGATIEWRQTMGVRYPARSACRLPERVPTEPAPANTALVHAAAAAERAVRAGADHAVAATALIAVRAEIGSTRRQLRAVRDRWIPAAGVRAPRADHRAGRPGARRGGAPALGGRTGPGKDGLAMRRILLAVDDSPAGLAAARVAVDAAVAWTGELRAVHVLVDGDVQRALASRGGAAAVRGRRDLGAQAVLQHVTDLAVRAGITVETLALEGQPARRILEQADGWPADLIVLGGAGRGRIGEPYVGAQVQHVLEFAQVPVLVVPPR